MEYLAKTRSGKNLYIGAEGSEFTSSEIVVSRGGGNTPALWSLTLETLLQDR